MKIHIDVVGELQADTILRKMAKELGHSSEMFLDKAAIVSLRTVMRNTQPFDMKKKSKELGENAILRDISNAFKPVRNMRGASGSVISSLSAAEQHLNNVRNTKRNVSSKAHKKHIVYRVYKKMIEDKQAKVGEAKSAWAHPLLKKNSRVPKWISRHGGNGSGEKIRLKNKPYWLFKGEPKQLRSPNVLGERGLIRSLKWQERNLKTQFRNEIRGRARKLARQLAK